MKGEMMMEESNMVTLNDDQKEVIKRRSNDAFFAIKQLNDWVQSNSLTVEMRETLPSLITHHLTDIKKTVGFTGEEPDHIKEMTRQMNQNLHNRIAELEKMVDSKNSILSVKQQLHSIDRKINKWWDEKGFNYIQDITFTGGGNIKVVFGIMLDSLSLNYSDTPDTDKNEAKAKVQGFVDNGFMFVKYKHGREKDLIDCDHNRELLLNLIKSAFPSANITSFRNHRIMQHGEDKGKFLIRDFEVYIYDYEDIENL
jgi:hypothetical protein